MKKRVWLGIFLYSLFLIPHSTLAAPQTFSYPGSYPTVITTSSPTTANVSVTFPLKNRKAETQADICVFNDEQKTCDTDANTGDIPNAIFHKNVPTITQNSDLKVSFSLNNLDPTKGYYVNFTVHYKKDGIYYTSDYSSHFTTQIPNTFNYTLDVSASGDTIKATLGGATGSRSKYQLIIQDTPFTSDTYTPKASTGIPAASDPTIRTPDSKGTVSWSIEENYNHTYYVRVVEIPPSLVTKPSYVTPSKTVQTIQPTLFFNHLSTTMQGTNVFVEGLIDTVKQPNYLDYKVTLTVSKNADLSNPIQANMPSLVAGTLGAPTGISNGMDNGEPTPEDPAGSYYWVLTGVIPGTTYYMQQTFTLKNMTVKDRIESFSGDTGAIIPPTAAGSTTTTDLNTGTYKLLSKGFPGLTSLPDPITCAAQRADAKAKGVPGPQFCDLNDILNYFLRLMIGLSAVFLVVQLMIQGYIIMTTDVPFLRAGAKSTFFSGLLGLLLVLTSYILLNTINPKLVSENVGVVPLAITIDGDTNAPTIFVSSGQMSPGIICPGNGRSGEVRTVANSFIGRVTYKYGAKSAAAQSDGKALLDCSAWANTVLKCSGYSTPKDYINSGSGDIFSKGEHINMATDFRTDGSDVYIKNVKLNPGDLVGWTQATSTYGHVILYVGNATFMDSHSSKVPGGAIGTFSAQQIQDRYSKLITSVKRTPL